MIDQLVRRLLRAYEERIGVRLPYLQDVTTHRPGALVPLIGLALGSRFGRRMPSDALHMVRIGASQAQDCGACVQIAVNFAIEDGLPRSAAMDALGGKDEHLSPELRSALRFGRALAVGSDAEAEREFIRSEWGPPAVVEASIAAAYAVAFPIVKRGMGHARACDVENLRFDGKEA